MKCRIMKCTLTFITLVFLLSMFLQPTFAFTGAQQWIPGNNPELDGYTKLTVDPPESGQYTKENQVVSVTISSDKTSMDWSSTMPVAYVFVKGGTLNEVQGGYLYTYDPTQNADTGLVAGTNKQGRSQEISHITFYYKTNIIPELGSICGTKYNDSNGDGNLTGESGLGGVVIKLFKGSAPSNPVTDQPYRSIETGADGGYSFTGLEADTYYVYEVVPGDYEQTYPETGYYTVTLGAGQNITNRDYGNYLDKSEPELGSICGTKYNDSNGDGNLTGESGLGGVVIKLFKGSAPSNPVTDQPYRSTQTGTDGGYSFNGLEADTYYVYEVVPGDYEQTYPETGYYTVTLGAGQNITNRDFGNYHDESETGLGSISGTKYNDSNGDGNLTGESGLGGVVIKLFKGSAPTNPVTDQPYRSTQTGSDGRYEFANLEAGTYYVYEIQNDGWKQTYPATGHYTVELKAGEKVQCDFGNTVIANDNHHHGGGGGNGGNNDSDLPGGDVTPPGEETNPPEDDGELPIPGVISPPPTDETNPPEVIVTPGRVPAGDPTITVTAGPDTKRVYAVLPDGRTLNLKKGKVNIWKVSFMVPFGTPDGSYNVKVFVVGFDGLVHETSYTITIDNSLPVMKIKKLPQAEGSYRLQVTALFNATSMSYISETLNETIGFTRVKGRWVAKVPAGRGYIRAIDESGYVVIQHMDLAEVAAANNPNHVVQNVKTSFNDAVRSIVPVKPNPQPTKTEDTDYAAPILSLLVITLMLLAGTRFRGAYRLPQ